MHSSLFLLQDDDPLNDIIFCHWKNQHITKNERGDYTSNLIFTGENTETKVQKERISVKVT